MSGDGFGGEGVGATYKAARFSTTTYNRNYAEAFVQFISYLLNFNSIINTVDYINGVKC